MDGMHEGYHTEDWQNGWEAFPSEPARPEADPWEGSFLPLTHHARKRMQQRRIDLDMVELVIQFGREVCTRGALIFAIGRNEIATAAKRGNNLQHLDGVHVVTSHDDGSVLTVYRNRDLGNLKTNLGFGKRWRQKKWGKKCRSLS